MPLPIPLNQLLLIILFSLFIILLISLITIFVLVKRDKKPSTKEKFVEEVIDYVENALSDLSGIKMKSGLYNDLRDDRLKIQIILHEDQPIPQIMYSEICKYIIQEFFKVKIIRPDGEKRYLACNIKGK
jgi:hypothetical protein